MLEKGIRQIKDVVRDGVIMNVQLVKREKNLNELESIKYISVYSCIENKVKDLLTIEQTLESMSRDELVKKLERENSKIIYQSLLNQKIERPTSEAKILEKLAIHLDDNDWISIYCIPFWATVEVKLRSFQISINHFYYFTNEKLHLIGLSNAPY